MVSSNTITRDIVSSFCSGVSRCVEPSKSFNADAGELPGVATAGQPDEEAPAKDAEKARGSLRGVTG
jgi:hypothetical protein